MIPLQDASHADVVDYSVHTPMRYTEFFALLADGRKVRLKDTRQFIAWLSRGRSGKRNFLFQGRHGRLELQAETEQTAKIVKTATSERAFVARDGSPFVVRRWGRVFPVSLGSRTRDYEPNGLYAFTQLQ